MDINTINRHNREGDEEEMGVGSYVKGSEHKKYEQKYQFYTSKGIGRLLKDFHKLRNRAFEKGDIAAIDITLDLKTAIKAAKLTDKQAEALFYLYELDMKQGDAAELLGIDDSTLSRNKAAALEKIAQVYKSWNYIE